MWIPLFFVFVGVVCILSIIFSSHFGFNELTKIIIGCLSLCFIFISGYILGVEMGFKNSLLGKNPYKMEIKYEMKDSVYVPSDTVFVMIN